MNVLLVNWQDLENPQAGGAEIHLFEIFTRLAAAGHRVRLVCSGWKRRRPRPRHRRGIEVRSHRAAQLVRRPRPRRGAARGAAGAAGRRGRGHQQAPALRSDVDRCPLLRAHSSPVRGDRVSGGALAHGRGGLGGRAAIAGDLSTGGLSRHQREHPGRPRRPRHPRRPHPGHPSRGGQCALRALARGTARARSAVLVRGTAQAL